MKQIQFGEGDQRASVGDDLPGHQTSSSRTVSSEKNVNLEPVAGKD